MHRGLTMNAETAKTGVERENTLAHLVALAETGRDDDVQAEVAALHPADAAELINLLERAGDPAESLSPCSRRTPPPLS